MMFPVCDSQYSGTKPVFCNKIFLYPHVNCQHHDSSLCRHFWWFLYMVGVLKQDLIQFLKDAGPLKRSVNQELTSPRLRKSLHAIEKLEQRDMEQDDRRKVTDMPLMGTEMDFVTKRTTNFSTAAMEEDKTFGMTAVEMYSMLAFNKPGIEIWKNSAGGDAADKDRHLELIESCRKYLELPVILKDENKEYIGLAKSLATSADLLQVALTPAIGVQLVLAELLNRETKLDVNQPQTTAKE